LKAVKDAIGGKEDRFVLKPQREGGGDNYYGKILANKLAENVVIEDNVVHLKDIWAQFILMERLFPPQQLAILLRSGVVEGTGLSISESGCFGTLVIRYDGEVLLNEYAGFLMRTKLSNIDEGAVASGYATLSSPYLC